MPASIALFNPGKFLDILVPFDAVNSQSFEIRQAFFQSRQISINPVQLAQADTSGLNFDNNIVQPGQCKIE